MSAMGDLEQHAARIAELVRQFEQGEDAGVKAIREKKLADGSVIG